MLTYVRTNIFDSPAQTLVNTVNIVGVMGKGIALQYKQRYPDMFKAYKKLCDDQALEIGKLHLWRAEDRWILNFPTKTTWRRPSEQEYIVRGLETFVSSYKRMGISSISFPPLGCGNGNLEWKDVKPIMEHYLSKVDIPVYIHDRQVSKTFVAEHENESEVRIPISYGEFVFDIKESIISKKSFSTLSNSSEFTAKWSQSSENIEIHRGVARVDYIDNRLIEAAWSSLQSGLLTNEQFADEAASKLKSYLFPILAALPYVKVAEISRPNWPQLTPGHGLYIDRADKRNRVQNDAVSMDGGAQTCLSL